MKEYKVSISFKAKEQVRDYLKYLRDVKKNPQAVDAVSEDYFRTIGELEKVAGSLKLVDDEELAKEGIRKIFFKKHDYVILYELIADEARIHAVYHTLQDYENLFKREMKSTD